MKTSRWVLACGILLAFLTCATCPAAEPDGSQDSPAGWLDPAGKDPGWVGKTEQCREYLKALKTDDPVVKKHLARLKERCAALRKMNKPTGWYAVVPFSFLEAMLADLSKGVEPIQRYAGQGFGYPYWSDTTKQIESVWIQAPAQYDPAKEYQLFMYYKCGGGIYYKDGKAAGGCEPPAAMCLKDPDTFHAWSSLYYGVKGRMGVDKELQEFVANVTQDLASSPQRVFLSGWSDGGFTSLWLASRYPHLVAGIAPNCANWQYGNVEQVGLCTVPVLVVDGWSDGGYLELNINRLAIMSGLGYDFGGLFGFHGHAYTPYDVEESFLKIMEWSKSRRLNPNPKRVRYATWSLCWNRAFWFSIERMADPTRAAWVDAEIKDGNRIEVKAGNIAACKLVLNDKLVDPAKPVTVVANGAESYAGPFQPELFIELQKLPAG